MISTAKEGVFKKQSVVFFDASQGMDHRKPVAKIVYNDVVSSAARLEIHDAIAGHEDAAGMDGHSLTDALRLLFQDFNKQGVGFGALFEDV